MVGFILMMYSFWNRASNGFTLFEVVLSVAIMSIIAGIGVPVVGTLINRDDLSISAQEIVNSARRAQVLAKASKGDTSWGVKVATDTIVLFQGTSFSSRNSGLDEVYDMSPAITLSGTTEFVFNKFTGEPTSIGSITLTIPRGASSTISINEKGVVSY